jgi:hypothetical protein
MGAASSDAADESTEWDASQYDRLESIRKLSLSADSFLVASAAFVGETGAFSLQYNLDHMKCAVRADSRLTQWLPKLVPKHISEEEFWSNYVSHVMASGGFPRIVPRQPHQKHRQQLRPSSTHSFDHRKPSSIRIPSAEPVTPARGGVVGPSIASSPAAGAFTPRRSRATSALPGCSPPPSGGMLHPLPAFPACPVLQPPQGEFTLTPEPVAEGHARSGG